jgi:hypothetical protein
MSNSRTATAVADLASAQSHVGPTSGVGTSQAPPNIYVIPSDRN